VALASVLITGGTGLIGSHLAGKLAQCGYNVTVLGKSSRFAVPEAVPQAVADRVAVIAGDSSDPETLAELVEKADVVFHKAASVGMAGAVESARDYVGANMAGTANLIDALRTPGSKVKKVILGSSVSVYGEGNYNCPRCGLVRPELRGAAAKPASTGQSWNPPCPICAGGIEAVPTAENSVCKGESIYAVTKKAQEDLLTGVCRQFGLPLTILRYSTVLGPGQSWHNPYTRVLELLAAGEAPVIHEDGMQTRDFIFVDDLVEANILALTQQDAAIDLFNVASLHMPLLHFVQNISQAVASALSRKAVEPLVDGKLIAGDVRHCWVDAARLTEKFGFTPRQDMAQGAQSLVEWFVRFKGLVPAPRS